MTRLTFEHVKKFADKMGVQIDETGCRRWEVWHPDVQGITAEVHSVLELWSEVHDFAEMAKQDKIEIPEEMRELTIDIV